MKDYTKPYFHQEYRWVTCPELNVLLQEIEEVVVITKSGKSIIFDIVYDGEEMSMINHTIDFKGNYYQCSDLDLCVPVLNHYEIFDNDSDYPKYKLGFSLQYRYETRFDWVVTVRLLEGEDGFELLDLLEKLTLKKMVVMAYEGYNHK